MVEAFPSSFDEMTRSFGIAPLPDAEASLRHSVEYIVSQNRALRRSSETETMAHNETALHSSAG